MATDATPVVENGYTAAELSTIVLQQLYRFCEPLLVEFDRLVDKRLVRTFFLLLCAIIRHRHRQHGLLLSELGAFITSAEHAPAGTKRLSNLLRSPKWEHTLVKHYLSTRAEARLAELEAARDTALVIWDESVIEKPESIAAEGLCAVRSAKAARLRRIKPGFYNPPGGRPVFVPGLQWISLMLTGLYAAPCLCRMHFWTRRGEQASDRRTEEGTLFIEMAQRWKRRVVHVFDRGYAGEPWLQLVLSHDARFVLRWPKHLKLVGPDGMLRKAWQITRGQRSISHQMLYDVRNGCLRRTGLYYTPVRHKAFLAPLYLVVSRPGRGRAPWYLLTNEPVTTVQQAWRIVHAYARRWQVEMAFRYAKSELAMESPRLWFWQNRMKLMAIVSLVLAFLLEMGRPAQAQLVEALLRKACPRTGKRSREVSAPLYRVRLALSHLWNSYRPDPVPLLQNSG